MQKENGKAAKQKKEHLLSKISDSDSKDEDGYGSVVLSRKPKSKKRLSARKPPPIEDSDSSDFEEESRDISKPTATPKTPVIDRKESAPLPLVPYSSSKAETELDEEYPRQDKATKEKALVKSTKYAAEDGDTDVILIDDSDEIQEVEPDKVEAKQLLKTKIKLSEPQTSASKKASKEKEKKKKTEKRAGKEKKTHRASQQQIGTANSSGCPLAKEIARLGELDRQQPPPSSSNKVVIFSVKLQ